MPKIIKSIKEDSLYGTKAPKYYLESKPKAQFQDGTTIVLTDDGTIYQIGGETSYDGGWNARKYSTDPLVEDKTNIYKMLIGAKYTELESNWVRTKKDLLEAIEAGTLKWQTDPIPERIRQSKAKKRAEKKVRKVEMEYQKEPELERLNPPLKNPWMIPAILFIGVFIAVVVLS
ncbi:MAG: hypothetical protein ACJZ78_00770 [Prochlorococcus marinus]|tara:strand:+ start:598 stop:1119 length:522 start_codon:yes stop_codon:yes gene_type:complete